MYQVLMKSVINDDFPREGQYVGENLANVNTLSEASQACLAWIDEHRIGGGQWDSIIFQNGKKIGEVSYNGRILNVDGSPANSFSTNDEVFAAAMDAVRMGIQGSYIGPEVSITVDHTPRKHPKVLHGQCDVCKHYGSDCTGNLHEREHPNIIIPAEVREAALRNGWVDASWHNDTCPHFQIALDEGEDLYIALWCDAENAEEREMPGARFSVAIDMGGIGIYHGILNTEDAGEVVAWLDDAGALWRKLLTTAPSTIADRLSDGAKTLAEVVA